MGWPGLKSNYQEKGILVNKKCSNSGRILLLEINTGGSLFVLINIYNANNEPDQLKTLTNLGEVLECVGDIQNKNTIFWRWFKYNFWFFFWNATGE